MLNLVIGFKLFIGGQGKDKNRDGALDKAKLLCEKALKKGDKSGKEEKGR